MGKLMQRFWLTKEYSALWARRVEAAYLGSQSPFWLLSVGYGSHVVAWYLRDER
jgi:hypothetical protein